MMWSQRKSLFSVLCSAALLCLLLGCSDSGSSSATLDAPQDDISQDVPQDDESSDDPGLYSVTLTWDAPLENEDGSALNDLSGYRVYEGSETGVYSQYTDTDLASTSVTIGDLAGGSHYFAVAAYDASGNESELSNELVVSLGN